MYDNTIYRKNKYVTDFVKFGIELLNFTSREVTSAVQEIQLNTWDFHSVRLHTESVTQLSTLDREHKGCRICLMEAWSTCVSCMKIARCSTGRVVHLRNTVAKDKEREYTRNRGKSDE